MDWSNYPAPESGLTGADIIDNPDRLAVFLGGGDDAVQTSRALFDLCALAAIILPNALDCLAVCYPREVTAWRQWDLNKPITVDDLLARLTAIPDPQPPAGGVLVPVLLDRIIATNMGNTATNFSMRYRQTTVAPVKTLTQLTPPASIEIDPRVLSNPLTPARVAVAITVDDSGQAAAQ